MFTALKLEARQALLNSKRKINPFILLLAGPVLSFYASSFLINFYYSDSFSLKAALFAAGTFLSFFAVPVSELILQAKLIISAKGSFSKIKISFVYAMKSCAVKLVTRLLKIGNFIVYEALPIAMLGGFLRYVYFNPVSVKAAAAYLIGTAVLALTGFAFYSVSVQKYSRALFFLAAYENISPLEALKLSKKMTGRGDIKLLMFKLSFLPWFVLCLAVIPVFFVIPYYKQSITCYFLNNG